jgi:hypothetical protein
MSLAMSHRPSEQSAVINFAVYMLKVLGYLPQDWLVQTHRDISLRICGEVWFARPDAVIMDGEDILLLVRKDKCHIEIADTYAQLVAAAIAAFQDHNEQ